MGNKTWQLPSRFTWITTPPPASIRGWSRRCCRFSRRSSATRGASTTAFGTEAKEAVDAAREAIAAAIGAEAREIVFTSGATESNNLAIRGLADRPRRKGNHIVSVTTEHKAVLDPLAATGATRIRGDAAAGRAARQPAGRLARSAASRRRLARRYAPRLRDAGQQRNRRDSADCRNRRDLSASAACRCTATPRRRSARCRSMSRPWASI